MATSKSRVTTDKNNHELVASLKYRVKELEEEVATLKGRLDDLRRAKNTTITKREREIVEVGFPKRDPKYEAKIEELQKQFRALEQKKNKEIEDLKQKYGADLEEARSKWLDLQKQLEETHKKTAGLKACNHDDEITKLKKKVGDLEGDNAALLIENNDLKERVTSLVSELSMKEARWCETEEKLNLKIKEGWGEKYRQWMEETERKIQELQEANTLLRTYLHRSGREAPPDGRFSGEGPS